MKMKKTRTDSVRGYRIDFSCDTVYLNYSFAAAATRDFLSPEAKRLREIKRAFPTFNVIVKAGKKITTTRKTKRLTYKNMEAYIGTLANADVQLVQFKNIKLQSKTQHSPYKYVRDWFEAQFPKYKEAVVFNQKDEEAEEKPLSNAS